MHHPTYICEHSHITHIHTFITLTAYIHSHIAIFIHSYNIASLSNRQAAAWARSKTLSSRAPPPGYVCFRCGMFGHFIYDCPTNGDPTFNVVVSWALLLFLFSPSSHTLSLFKLHSLNIFCAHFVLISIVEAAGDNARCAEDVHQRERRGCSQVDPK